MLFCMGWLQDLLSDLSDAMAESQVAARWPYGGKV